MRAPEPSKSAPEVERLVQAVDRLLNCPDLNLDELDDETSSAIEEAGQTLVSINLPR